MRCLTLILLMLLTGSMFAASVVTTGDHPALQLLADRIKTALPDNTLQIKLDIDKKLSPTEYCITYQGNVVLCQGGAPRGVWMGVNKLLSLLKEHALKDGIYRGKPEWEHIYFTDQLAYMASREQLLQLANLNVFGYTWHCSANDWHDFLPEKSLRKNDRTVGAWLQEIDAINRLELFELMLTMHICNSGTKPPLDCSDEKQIDDFISRLRLAAQHGIKHIMVCADDHTKFREGHYICTYPSEEKRFGGSVGAAHGYLCKRIAESLFPEFPDLEISFVPPPYSLLDHTADSSANQDYFRDWRKVAPKNVMLVWTGPRIIPDIPMTKEHFTRFQALAPEHRLIYWDNGECIGQPWQRWMTDMYPGAAQDNNGIIFVNNHSFTWADTLPFMVCGADYLNNMTADDFRTTFIRAAEKLYGKKISVLLTEASDLVYEYKKLSSWHITKQPEILNRLAEINAELGKSGLPTWRLDRWIKQNRDIIEAKRPEYSVPSFSGQAFASTGLTEAFRKTACEISLPNSSGKIYLASTKTSLLVGFVGPIQHITPVKPTRVKTKFCYDFIQVAFANDIGGTVSGTVNAVGETTGEVWPAQHTFSGKDYHMLLTIPLASLAQKGITTIQTSHKLYADIARVRYTVDHNGISPNRVPAILLLK